MDLSPEDSLRLNVMLANSVAVRIDEGAKIVYCLASDGNEARVQLYPNCKAEQYIRKVRELLSSNILGSPGGYPVFLKRWTRMGQAGELRLADLLMLGEPEAIVAVSGSTQLTDELAERAWWAMPDSENARRMLRRECVVKGKMGKILADFLLEFLPFEQEPGDIIESVKLVLQPGLITEEERLQIWQRGKQKNVFLVGFLHTVPEDLPDTEPARQDYAEQREKLEPLIKQENPYAVFIDKILSETGQSFIQACHKVLKKPANQDVVVSFLDAIEQYFSSFRHSAFHYETVDQIIAEVEKALEGNSTEIILPEELRQFLQEVPGLGNEIRASLILAHTGEPVIRQIFARTDSVGSVMRKKIEPVSTPIQKELKVLQGLS